MPAEKEKRASAVAQKLEEERKAGESARMAKAEQHRAVQQHHKQAAEEVSHLPESRAFPNQSLLAALHNVLSLILATCTRAHMMLRMV